jgi:hypothetical protein
MGLTRDFGRPERTRSRESVKKDAKSSFFAFPFVLSRSLPANFKSIGIMSYMQEIAQNVVVASSDHAATGAGKLIRFNCTGMIWV